MRARGFILWRALHSHVEDLFIRVIFRYDGNHKGESGSAKKQRLGRVNTFLELDRRFVFGFLRSAKCFMCPEYLHDIVPGKMRWKMRKGEFYRIGKCLQRCRI